MYFLILLVWCFLSTSLEAAPPHEELVGDIMEAAKKSFGVTSNVAVLKRLVYEQDFDDLQGVDDPTPLSLFQRLNPFSAVGSGFEPETPERSSDKRRDKFFNYLVGLYKEFPLVRIGYNPSEVDPTRGYVTLCFLIQPDYHHAALVLEYP